MTFQNKHKRFLLLSIALFLVINFFPYHKVEACSVNLNNSAETFASNRCVDGLPSSALYLDTASGSWTVSGGAQGQGHAVLCILDTPGSGVGSQCVVQSYFNDGGSGPHSFGQVRCANTTCDSMDVTVQALKTVQLSANGTATFVERSTQECDPGFTGTPPNCVPAYSYQTPTIYITPVTYSYQTPYAYPSPQVSTVKVLSVSVSGEGSVTDGSDTCSSGTCGKNYITGASISLTAHPASGSIFAGWGGDCAGFSTSQTCSGSMSVDRSVSANFQSTAGCGAYCYQYQSPLIYTTPDTYLTPSTPAVCGNGQLEVGEQCDFGTPGLDPGDCQAPQHPGTQCSSQDCRCHDVYAYPYPTPLVLLTVPAKPTGGTIVSSPSGINCGTGSCSAGYLPGTQITLHAYPDSSYWKFAGWTGVCAGTTAPICILSITVPSAVSATFDLRTFQYKEF